MEDEKVTSTTLRQATEGKAHRSVRWPVKRARAESYLIISIATFAATVILTRVFLDITGYPQVGNGVLHIAHALWGGLLLIIAAILPLILINDWALLLSAVLSGLGVGLFIDEVGKFITQKNDYFFPPAAPVVYGFFMILVLVMLTVRRTRRDQPRNELYRALDALHEVIEGDLDADEWKALHDRLKIARQSDDRQIAGLAAALQSYLRSSDVTIFPTKPGLWQRFVGRVRSIGQRVGRKWHRRLIIITMALVVIGTALSVLFLLLIASTSNATLQQVVNQFLSQDEIASANNGLWFYLRVGLELLVSVLALITVILLLVKRERAAIRVALVALLISLTGDTLLAFYLDQFRAATTALYQFLVLLMVVAYQRWYLRDAPASAEQER
jgi:hypothetical protein